jgi:hypothetical protein
MKDKNFTPLPMSKALSDEAFVSYLKLTYRPSAEVSSQCALLLPIAIAEDRLLSALRTTILREALSYWNKPQETHFFVFTASVGRWTYKGTHKPTFPRRTTKANLISLFGRLATPLEKGRFCSPPGKCLIEQYSGFNFPQPPSEA